MLQMLGVLFLAGGMGVLAMVSGGSTLFPSDGADVIFASMVVGGVGLIVLGKLFGDATPRPRRRSRDRSPYDRNSPF